MVTRLALKDIRIFLSDRKALGLTFLLPIVLVSIFYFAFGGSGNGGNQPVVRLVVCDLDSSTTSRELVARLDSLQGLHLDEVDESSGHQLVVQGKRAALLILHSGLADSVQSGTSLPAELIYDSGRPMEFGILSSILFSEIGEFGGESRGRELAKQQMIAEFGMPENMADSLLTEMMDDGQSEAQAPLQLTEVVGERDNSFALIQAVAGTAVMLLLFGVAAMGSEILKEKEEGTLRRLLSAPFPPERILWGKLLSTVIIATTQLLVLFLFAAVAFGLDLSTNIPALLLMIVTTALVCASFGVLLASVAGSRKQVDSMSTVIILVMSAVGGSMMPVVFMPEFLQKLAVGTVNYWSIQGFYDIYWRKLGFSAVLDNAAILLGISVLLLAISSYFFRRKVIQLA